MFWRIKEEADGKKIYTNLSMFYFILIFQFISLNLIVGLFLLLSLLSDFQVHLCNSSSSVNVKFDN